jgi:hypothetical protein
MQAISIFIIKLTNIGFKGYFNLVILVFANFNRELNVFDNVDNKY